MPVKIRLEDDNNFIVEDRETSEELLVVDGNTGDVKSPKGNFVIGDGGLSAIAPFATTPVPSGGAGTMAFQNGHAFVFSGSFWKEIT